ncbi:hypothetical protein LZ31DRAFT_554096 [Colletotrichum somersetense]|nr:hypothetical protein LZ31DRAFT_554096 [Colletotrichum somersetense]
MRHCKPIGSIDGTGKIGTSEALVVTNPNPPNPPPQVRYETQCESYQPYVCSVPHE